MDTSMGGLESTQEAMVKVSVIQVRRTPCCSSSSMMAFCSAVGKSKTGSETSPAMRVRACYKSISRQAWLNPRIAVREPTPMATASMTNRNLNEDARASRHAILKAVVQEKFMACLSCAILLNDQPVAQGNAAPGAARQDRILRRPNPRGAFTLLEGNRQIQNVIAVLRVQ